MTSVKADVAQSLLKIGAVGFTPDRPITFKSGILSPVYVDNRRLPYYPGEWREVIAAFQQVIQEKGIHFDVIAGIETAGIPHSAALGFASQKSSVFVRKATKDHGTKKRVEGGDVRGKTVLLIEDHITTGGSSLSGVEALRAEGATVTHCLAITSYEFAEAVENFQAAEVTLETLTSFSAILQQAEKSKALSTANRELIEDWLRDPHGWASRQGK